MDYDSIYESIQSEIVYLPNHEYYNFNNQSVSDVTRNFVNVARQFVSDDYADSLRRFLNNIIESSKSECEFCDYKYDAETSEVDNDELTTERDELLSVITSISDTINRFETKHSKHLRLTRLEIIPLIEQLKDLVKDYD